MQNEFLARCFESGRRAYLAGIKFNDCPLAKASPARRFWKKGWRAAENNQ